MRRIGIIMLCSLLLISAAGEAEIEKKALICKEAVCFVWWPKLQHLPGWHHDEDASIKFSVNMFANDKLPASDVVMYAKAKFQPKNSTKTLNEFIADDISSFSNHDSREIDSIQFNEASLLRAFVFTPKGNNNGRWELVSYGQEDDKDGNKYFLIFTISAKDQKTLEEFRGDYEKFLGSYFSKTSVQQKP